MKILYITSARLPTVKAHGYQIVKTCEGLSKEHRLLLLAPVGSNGSIHDFYSAQPNFQIQKCFYVDSSLLRRKAHRLWFAIHLVTFASAASIWTLSRRHEFDLVYSRDPMSLYLLSKVQGIMKAPLIYESHQFPEKGHPFQVELAKKLDGLVVVTEKMRERFLDAGVKSEKILVEPDAVNLNQFDVDISKADARRRIGIRPDIIVATFTGRFHTMEMEKGIPETIDAAKHLLSDFPTLHFYFVGGPCEREASYRARIESRSIPQNRFSFLDRQPVADLPLWLKASDMLLMPHPRNDFYSFYVSPLKMFEYMASRRPIVGSKLPAIEEILTDGEHALLAEPGDPASIAANIRRLLENPGLGERLAGKAFGRVARYTWDERAKRIAIFASNLVASARMK